MIRKRRAEDPELIARASDTPPVEVPVRAVTEAKPGYDVASALSIPRQSELLGLTKGLPLVFRLY